MTRNDTQTNEEEKNKDHNIGVARTIFVISRSGFHGNLVTGRLQCPEVRKRIPSQTLRESSVPHGSEFRHVNVDPWASPPCNAQ